MFSILADFPACIAWEVKLSWEFEFEENVMEDN